MSNQGAESAQEPKEKSNPWWHTLLVYPTLAVALVSAFPSWSEIALTWYHELKNQTYGDAKKLNEWFDQHGNCTRSPLKPMAGTGDVEIMGTICPTGDLFLHVNAPRKNFVHVVYMSEIIAGKPETPSAPRETDTPLVSSIDTEPREASLTRSITARVETSPAESLLSSLKEGSQAQAQSTVECQGRLDNRTIVRRLRVADQCFDETIDTFTGAVTGNEPINCALPCKAN